MSEASRLQKLEQQQEAIREKIRRERAKIADQERKKDTRRKIITGAVVLAHATHHPSFQAELRAILIKSVENKDRYLFPEIFCITERTLELANDNHHEDRRVTGAFPEKEQE
jgi:hypothetical protein